MNKHKNNSGFTLIELLMVIAIIGILAGILIPTVGAVRSQANKAASKAQLSNYVTAIQGFKGEYGYYPLFGATATGDSYEVPLASKSVEFIETMSGRSTDGDPLSPAEAKVLGNRKNIAFHSFSESEFLYDDVNEQYETDQLADRFDNTNIIIVIDANGDGFVTPAPTANNIKGVGKIRRAVTAYVDTNPDTAQSDDPTYALWE